MDASPDDPALHVGKQTSRGQNATNPFGQASETNHSPECAAHESFAEATKFGKTSLSPAIIEVYSDTGADNARDSDGDSRQSNSFDNEEGDAQESAFLNAVSAALADGNKRTSKTSNRSSVESDDAAVSRWLEAAAEVSATDLSILTDDTETDHVPMGVEHGRIEFENDSEDDDERDLQVAVAEPSTTLDALDLDHGSNPGEVSIDARVYHLQEGGCSAVIRKHFTVMDTKGKLFVLYDIDIRGDTATWAVRHRYSDFVRLHKALVGHSVNARVFKLPPKRYLGNLKKANIQRRQRALQTYLNSILAMPALAKHPILLEWMEATEESVAARAQLDIELGLA
eukprot:m.531434 g.531434  ORF g.531434 m.531434 type:complete len:341 (+) comp22035_c0_seq2:343-1365(+)